MRKFVINSFEITNDTTDFLTNDKIREVFDTVDFGDISSKKISIELKAMGLKNAKKGARGWLGIKTKPCADAGMAL